MQGMQVPSLGEEDPLEKEMATHSSILAWRILRSQAGPMGVAKSQTRLGTHTVCHLLSRLVSDRWTRTYWERQPSNLQPATQCEVPRPAVSGRLGPRGLSLSRANESESAF